MSWPGLAHDVFRLSPVLFGGMDQATQSKLRVSTSLCVLVDIPKCAHVSLSAIRTSSTVPTARVLVQ